MRKELEDLLFQRYPMRFEKIKLALGVFSMSWGFECGDG
jgi:hypothetical protein